jgi:sigma-B regulation protein RsbU (phosphoserine phosphatase)
MPGDDRLNLLLRTLADVAVSVDVQPTLAVLLGGLQHLVPFAAGGIFVRDADRDVVRARATRGYPDDLEMPTTLGLAGDVLRTGRPHLAMDVRSEPAYVPIRPSTAAQLTVPLASPRGVVGAIVLEADEVGAFGDDDLTLVILFAQQATIVIERALLHEQLMRQSRLDRDMEIARDILTSLTPTAAPLFPGMDVFGRSVTAETVGGDAFDFISYPDAQVGIAVWDAKGKGLPGALLAVAHRAMVHAFVHADLRLRTMFGRVSDLLGRSLPLGSFVTTFYGIIDSTERQMMYVNAGHPSPLVVRANGVIEELTPTGPALGFPDVGPMREAYTTFGRGEGVVLFTDGVIEAGATPHEFLEVAGVRTCIGRLWHRGAEDIVEGILEEAQRHAGGAFRDDATVVVVKFD